MPKYNINKMTKEIVSLGFKDLVYHVPTKSVFLVAVLEKPSNFYSYRGNVGIRIFQTEINSNAKNAVTLYQFRELVRTNVISPFNPNKRFTY